MKGLILAVACVSVSGCVFNIYPTLPPMDLQTASQNTEVTVSMTPPPHSEPIITKTVTPPVVETRIVTVPESCERFTWTKPSSVPPQAGFVADVLSKRDDYTPQEINNLLLEYIFSLRQYVTVSYQDLRVEYLAYLKRCEYPNDKEIPENPYPPS